MSCVIIAIITMRDLIFRNLTSVEKKRRIITSSEIVDKAGVRTIIHRHFICIAKEIKNKAEARPKSDLYVLKEHNNKEHKEMFLYRIKGSVYTLIKEKLYLIRFAHSLRIALFVTAKSV